MVFLSLSFIACQKDVSQSQNVQQSPAAENMVSARQQPVPKKNFMVKTISIARWGYSFFYNQRGDLDSMQIRGNNFNETDRVHYHGSRIDSVTVVRNGSVVWVYTDIQYKGNLITGFKAYCRGCDQQAPDIYTFSYDHKGRMAAVGDQQLTYDANDDVILWTKPQTPAGTATYTYDDKPNPLYGNPLLTLFVRTDLLQFALSRHNAVTKTYNYGQKVEYSNTYNDRNQLQNKSFYDPGVFTTYIGFTYY